LDDNEDIEMFDVSDVPSDDPSATPDDGHHVTSEDEDECTGNGRYHPAKIEWLLNYYHEWLSL
jgi:hypothetical protein